MRPFQGSLRRPGHPAEVEGGTRAVCPIHSVLPCMTAEEGNEDARLPAAPRRTSRSPRMHGNGYLPEGPHGLGQTNNSPQGEVRAQTELPSTRPGAARLSHLPAVSPAPFLRPQFHCPLSSSKIPRKKYFWVGEMGRGW